MRQEVEAWGQQPGPLPLWLEKPGRTRQVEGEDADGRLAMAEIGCLVVHSSQLADQTAVAYAAAQAKAAERLAEPIRRVEARWLACAPDAAAARAAYAGRGQGRRGRPPHPWRSHALPSWVEAVSVPQKRPQRGRPPQTAVPPLAVHYRLVVHHEALRPAEATYRVDGPGHDRAARGVDRYGDPPGLSGAT